MQDFGTILHAKLKHSFCCWNWHYNRQKPPSPLPLRLEFWYKYNQKFSPIYSQPLLILHSFYRLHVGFKQMKRGISDAFSFPVFPQMVINSNSDSIKPEQSSPAGGCTNGKSWLWNNGNYNRQLFYTTKKMMYPYWQCHIWRPEGRSDSSVLPQGQLNTPRLFSWPHHYNFCHLNFLLQFILQITYQLKWVRGIEERKKKEGAFILPTGMLLFFLQGLKDKQRLTYNDIFSQFRIF